MTTAPALNPIFVIPPALSLAVGLFLAGLSLARGGKRAEARLFALVCVWWSLLSPAFISHFWVGDPDTLLTIERVIHFFYVYLPAITLAFFLRVLKQPHRRLVALSFGVSFLFSLTTPSDLYFNGLHRYSWGMIARGGPFFHLFGLYSFAVIAYGLTAFLRRLRTETNPILKLKFQYLLISFGLSGLLTLCNIPAMNGIDFYPLGNLSFLPLTVMAYGVLKHRLLDVRRMVHHSLAWLTVSALVLLPNAVLFLALRDLLRRWPDELLFLFLATWFGLNLIIFLKARPFINRTFDNTQKSLVQARMNFLEEISYLKNLEELSAALTRALSTGLGIPRAELYLRRNRRDPAFRRTDGAALELGKPLERFLVQHAGHIERHLLETRVHNRPEARGTLALLTKVEAAYLIPLVQANTLMAVILLEAKSDGLPLNSQESQFIRELAASGTIALFNSMLYQDVSDLRDRLQVRKSILQQEIRDREKAQRALATSERQYRLLAENVLDVIWIINLERNGFAYISPSVAHLTGYAPEEAVRTPLEQMLTAPSLAYVRNQLAAYTTPPAGSEPRASWSLNIEIELIRKDGATVWVETSVGPLNDPGLPYPAILGITRDITDRRRRMEMQQAKLAAEKANQAKSEFLANMSHELRTPLNHIIGFTELVIDQHFGPLNETQADYLKDVLHSSHHLLDLINDILDLSKVEAGKMSLDRSEFLLEEVLQGSLTMVKEKSLKHGIQLNLDIQRAPEAINADKRKFKQILYNLLSNAVKFTPDGGHVALAAAQIPHVNGDGPLLEVSVSDTGIGLAAENLERIFDTFEQVDSSADRHYEGTGLGLALSRRLAAMHGGRISAESKGLGRGSRFVLTLPLGQDAAADQPTGS